MPTMRLSVYSMSFSFWWRSSIAWRAMLHPELVT